ncbi:hypothetical protein [Desulfuromonas acetoxidans]|uniref:hypothetical protein n=1 Tax=Desulfuromonas acetoxidans TaxID=891 RepID=UPI00292CD798|nr:hypothetical protein [Desulfuromonas acetoxidans]
MSTPSTQSTSLDADMVHRLKRALTTDSDGLKEILQDPSSEVLHAALKNVALSEEHLLQVLKRHDLTSTFLNAVGRHKLSEKSRICMATLAHPAVSPALVKKLLSRLHLFEVLNLCYLPGQSADLRMAAELAIIQRLPMAPLGNRISLARRATATVLQALFKEGHPQVIEAGLNNPKLQEVALYQHLNGSNATAETISQIARHPRWSQRPNLRRAILKNRQTPRVWFIQFLPRLPRTEARNLLHSQTLSARQKQWIRDVVE